MFKKTEKAITNLSKSKLTDFADWFANHHADAWDEQIENDLRDGKLASLIAQAYSDIENGNVTEL